MKLRLKISVWEQEDLHSIEKAFTMCWILFFSLLVLQAALYSYMGHAHVHVVFLAIIGVIFTSLMKRSYRQWRQTQNPNDTHQ